MNDSHNTLDWLEKKRTLLTHLLAVGRQQLDLITAGDLTSLLKMLASKQRVLDGLQLVQQQLAPFFALEPQDRRWANGAEREQCAALVDQCEAILVEIMELERRCEKQLTIRRDDAAAELQGMHQSAQVRGAYESAPGNMHSSLDLSTR